MKKIFACDIDNTVSNQYLRCVKYYNPILNCIPDEFFHNNALIYQDMPILKAQEAILKLSRLYDIVWVSARHKSRFNITVKWLVVHSFPIDDIYLVEQNDNKIPVLEKLNPVVFVDDMRRGWEQLDPQLNTNFMKKLDDKKINYEIFNGPKDWIKIKA